MKHRSILLSLLLAAAATGCGNRSLVVSKPDNADLNRRITAMWSRDVHRVAKSGDWILTRSYSLTGDVITTATRGEEVSHASIYDARTGTIIEALRPHVREVPLESLLDRNDLVIVIRPSGLSEAQRAASVDRARARVGAEFDLTGMLGLGDDPDEFYCSELVYWASGIEDPERPRIIAPADLMKYGEVVYYGGRRSDPQVQAAASWSMPRGGVTSVTMVH